MRPVLAVMCVVHAACTDYAVHVDFDIPAAYRDDVDTVTLAVIVPPAVEPFDCDDLAYGEVTADTVHLATIQEITIAVDGGQAQLAGIPRTGSKLFHAQGLDAQELPLVAGCEELGDIDGVVDVTIDGEPTSVLLLPERDPGVPLPDMLRDVFVVDARGEPLVDVDVRFTVIGPAAETSMGTDVTDGNGHVEVALQPPSLPGPQALDVRTRFARVPPDSMLGFGPPPQLAQFDLPGDATDEIAPPTESLYVVGRVGPAGEAGFAALGPLDGVGTGRQVLLAWYDATQTPPYRTVTSPVFNGALALGLITPAGDSREHVFTITGSFWIEIDPADGGLITSPSPNPGRPAKTIAPAGACGAAGSDQVVVSYTDDDLEVYRADHSEVSGSPLIGGVASGSRIAGSGCVSATTDADLHRVIVYSPSNQALTVVADMEGGVRTGDLAALAQGLGFAPPVGGGEAHLLASEVAVDGINIGRWRLAPIDDDELALEKITSDGAAGPPLSTGGGDLDGDGQVDVLALLGLGDRDSATLFRLLIALSVEHGDGRLTGISEPSAAARPRTFLYDFDGDGTDDVLLATPDSALVWRMGE